MYPYSPNEHQPRQWFDRSQPQTLQIAVILLYINAGFAILGLLLATSAGLPSTFALMAVIIAAVNLVPAVGIANSRKWAWVTAVVLSAIRLALMVLVYRFALLSSMAGILSLVFAVALLALLVHPQSRSYERIWFR